MIDSERFDLEKEANKAISSMQNDWSDAVEKIIEFGHRCQFQKEIEKVNKYANAERIIEWIRHPKRKPAVHAFTEGPERQIGYAVEDLIRRCQDEILEKAADFVLRNPHDSTFDSNKHAALIRSLKTTPGDRDK